MSNIIGKSGKIPQLDKTIGEMLPGEVGYTVEWAIQNDHINESYTVGEKGGTALVRVECVRVGMYSITYESPVYRDIFSGR